MLSLSPDKNKIPNFINLQKKTAVSGGVVQLCPLFVQGFITVSNRTTREDAPMLIRINYCQIPVSISK